jgi:hypothetical protein
MWYLPVIVHLRRMFSNNREAQLLLWHIQQKRDGKIQHSADGRQWKHFDLSHEEKRAICKCLHGIRVPTDITPRVTHSLISIISGLVMHYMP